MKRVVHRLWLGPRPLPDDYAWYEDEWRRLNPDWEVYTYGPGDLPLDFAADDVIEDLHARDAGRKGIELYVQLADVLGYKIVHRFGGLYVNVDIQPLRPIPEGFITKAVASYEDGLGNVVNCAIGAPEPGDEFWGMLLERLPGRYFSMPGGEMNRTTGPGLLTEMARNFPDLIDVKPRATWNPVHWNQVPPGGDASGYRRLLGSQSIGLHHWGHRRDQRTNLVERATQ